MTSYIEVQRFPCINRIMTRNRCDQSSQTISYECQNCDSRFTSKVALKHHETLHSIVYECVWAECSNRFSNKSDYKRHMDAHTTEKFLPCAYCSKSCDHRDTYKNHVKEHIEKPLLSCQYCPAKFDQKTKLRVHEKKHNTAKFVHLYNPPPTSDVNTAVSKPSRCSRLKPIIRNLQELTKAIASEIDRQKNETGESEPETVSRDVTSEKKKKTSNLKITSSLKKKVTFSAPWQKERRSQMKQRSPSINRRTSKRTKKEQSNGKCSAEASADIYTFSEENEIPSSSFQSVPLCRALRSSTFFNCSLCKFGSNLFVNYRSHLLIHSRKRGSFICPTCKARLCTKTGLINHLNKCH